MSPSPESRSAENESIVKNGRESLIAELQQLPPDTLVGTYSAEVMTAADFIKELQEGTHEANWNAIIHDCIQRQGIIARPPRSEEQSLPKNPLRKAVQRILSAIKG